MPQSKAMVAAATTSLQLKCDLAEVRRASTFTREFLTAQGCSEDDIVDCDLALVEACTNAIQYADDAGRFKPVLLEISCTPAQIEFRVTDHTPGFEMPTQVHLPNPDSESGRGLFIIHAVMQSVEYVRGAGQNTLVMRRLRQTQGQS